MNEMLTKAIAMAQLWWGKLSPTARLGTSVLGGLLVLGIIGAKVIGSRDPFQVLYTDLQAEEARGVAKALGEQKINHIMSADNTTVSVPASEVARARMELAKAGLPGSSVVGFEKFDSATLGMSSYVQRIQYVRAVQGELTRSIQQLASVKRARVHISIPPKKTFLEEEEPPKSSVILELRRGQRPSKGEINGIAHLVASAVEGLKVNNVSIVDTQGNFLHRPEDEGSAAGMSSALVENQRNMETEFEKRVEEILTPVVGLGKVRAKVAAEIDPSRVNTTEESFDPEKSAVRNSVSNDEVVTGSKPNPVGIPGSRSNLPGAEAISPAVPMASTSSEKSVKNTSYNVPRKIQITDKPSGNLKRLTVAVIVDGYYTTVNGQEQFSPRSDEELKRLQSLVANSVGFDETRRDSITVSCLPFRNTELMPEEAPTPEVSWLSSQPMPLKIGLAFLAAMIPLALGLLLMLRRRSRRSSLEASLSEFPRTVAEIQAETLAAAGMGAGSIQGVGGVAGALGANGALAVGTLGEEAEPLEKLEEIELRRRILERLTSTPKKGLAVLEEWLEEPEEHSDGNDRNDRQLLRAVAT
jgi:flagellar M-ring protein FliF